MTFMVIERYKGGDSAAVYKRYREQGRMMPQGLTYIASWVESNSARCFQLMECDDPQLLDQWTANWSDLVEFEIVVVITSTEAADQAALRN